MIQEPDAVIRSVEGYSLKVILHKSFIEKISEDQYAELDSGDREEPLFSATAIEEKVSDADSVYIHKSCGEILIEEDDGFGCSACGIPPAFREDDEEEVVEYVRRDQIRDSERKTGDSSAD